ncbi:MAG TPA: YicC/YloC family endoribonuclease [Candidatus Eisenbacteria bacterium]|nr:YicC/YloC family endoribonuclease [Candidatus Eisenbacteria bacterium]
MRSMTGYGAATADAATAHLAVEIRGVNQRFLDVKVALPREYAAWEGEVRDRVRAAVERGRVDVGIARTPVAARRRYRVSVRDELAKSYVAAARQLARRLAVADTVTIADVLRLPDLFEVGEQVPALEPERKALRRALDGALRAFDRERRREGAHLQRELLGRTAALRKITHAIRARRPEVLAALDVRIAERVERLRQTADVEPQRIAQEIVTLAERGDITEELVRLESHLVSLGQTLRGAGSIGKRVEFLLQEIQRELNTTGSKASDLAINHLVVDGKGEVEKLREQVQNIE